MRNLRQPFFGMPEDAGILDAVSSSGRTSGFDPDNAGSNPATATDETIGAATADTPSVAESETGRQPTVAVPLGRFYAHEGENRAMRRKASATWVPPTYDEQIEKVGAPVPKMPTRRELFEQRRKHQRGKLDPELRRLQKEKARQK